jgi:hypothetical protein
VALIGALVLGALPSALAAPGDSAAEALGVGPDGRFAGTAQPQKSTWYVIHYQGSDTAATITLEYQPEDSNRTEIFLHTGTPQNPRRESDTATRSGNTLTITFSDPSARDVFIEVQNGHSDRRVSFVGSVSPSSAMATPAAGTATATAGPAAASAQTALTVSEDGSAIGTLGPRQAVWYRFWYGNPGADATISADFSASADNTDLNVYTGSDPNNLTVQTGTPTRANNTLTRRVNLSSPQFVYFSIANNNDATTVAYNGRVSPVFGTPTPVVTATATSVATATGVPAATATPQPGPTSTPQPAPAMPHDERYFTETGYRIDNDAIWSYFQARGRIDTFGFPVSRTFTFLGCTAQIFQRQIAQVCGAGANAQLMNMLDPDIFPYTRVNFSTFPPADDAMKNSTPPVSDPNYATRILEFIRQNAPDVFEGAQVNYQQTFFGLITPAMAGTSDPGILGLLNLEVWGAPISQPMRDPNNSDFIYQRWQRGIMHHIVSQRVTRGILLADYVKQIMRNSPELPPDLRDQARGGRMFAQYCPGAQNWLCRPSELPGTDLTFAFERG